VATCVIAFLVSQVLAVVAFGFVLGPEYQPFRGTLLRSMDRLGWQALFLPVAHLSFVTAFVWIYSRIVQPGARLRQGLRVRLPILKRRPALCCFILMTENTRLDK